MPGDERVPAEVLDLVRLLCQADWTQLSLAAEITEFTDYQASERMEEARRPSWAPRRPAPPPPPAAESGESGESGEDDDDEEFFGSWPVREMVHRLLVAPGGRFRLESHWGGEPASVKVSAGSGSGSGSGSARPEPGPIDPPCADLLCPAWLPARYRLELAGPAVVAGRHAHRVIATQRPVQQGRSRPRQSVPRPAHRGHQWPRDVTGRIDAAVDVELGILLRYELTYGGQVVRRHEVTSITIDPPQGADDQRFAAVPDDEDTSDATLFSGPGWERAKTAASAGAAALSFAIRHSPQRESPAGSRPDPQASPEPGESEWPGEPGGQEVLSLLYEAGLRRSEFDAELRTWTDATAAATAFAGATRNTTMSGVRRLSDALSDRATAWQVREAIKVGLPSRYRIDYIDGGIKRRTCTTDAADGTQRWRVYADHVTVGPLAGLPTAIARLVDPSWLLDWQLTGGAPVSVGGRPGLAIHIAERFGAPGPGETEALENGSALRKVPAEAVIDAELGILLRLTLAQAGQPSLRQTLSAVTVRERRDASAFAVVVPPGTRVVRGSGGLMDEIEVPAPVQTAVHLAGQAVTGVVRLGTFIDSLRTRRSGEPK